VPNASSTLKFAYYCGVKFVYSRGTHEWCPVVEESQGTRDMFENDDASRRVRRSDFNSSHFWCV
jgi:hypothetical protein